MRNTRSGSTASSVRGRIFITINEQDGALLASRMKMGEEQKVRLGHYPYLLTSQRAVYVDFTKEAHVGDSHAYFEGAVLTNERIRRFFDEAFNGAAAEAAAGLRRCAQYVPVPVKSDRAEKRDSRKGDRGALWTCHRRHR